MIYFFFFFNDTATTEIYTLSLHDALPIYHRPQREGQDRQQLVDQGGQLQDRDHRTGLHAERGPGQDRSEEHTSELQSLRHLVCRLLLEKKKKYSHRPPGDHHDTLIPRVPH